MRTRFTSPSRKFGAGVAASALIAGTVGLAGSGIAAAQPVEETDNEAITTALTSYLDAANSFDYEAFVASTCEAEVDFMNDLVGKLINGADLETIWERAKEVRGDDAPQIDILAIEDIAVEGDTATAVVTTQVDEREPATEEVQLILDEEDWKVCPDRSNINLDGPEADEASDDETDAPAPGLEPQPLPAPAPDVTDAE